MVPFNRQNQMSFLTLQIVQDKLIITWKYLFRIKNVISSRAQSSSIAHS